MLFLCVECLHWFFIFQQAETRTLHWLSCATSKDYSFTEEQIPAPCPQKVPENQPITAEHALRRWCQIKESPGGKRLLYSWGRWWRGGAGSVSQGSRVPVWPSNCFPRKPLKLWGSKFWFSVWTDSDLPWPSVMQGGELTGLVSFFLCSKHHLDFMNTVAYHSDCLIQ